MKKNLKVFYSWLKKNSKILKNIAIFIGAIAALFAIFDSFSTDKKSETNNIDSSTTTNNLDSSTTNNVHSSTTNIFIENNKNSTDEKNAYSNAYSLVGIYNKDLINEIENTGIIQIINNSKNKIIFSSSGDIYKYGNKVNEMYKNRQGKLQISVNQCKIFLKEFEIPSFGPSPRTVIEREINSEINNIITQNIEVISQKIHACINQ